MRCFQLFLILGMTTIMAQRGESQFWYPQGYGGYGMSKWGADPASGFMAGLGSYARNQGVYQEEKAKADAINVDTMIKWNKALRARQAALRAEKQKQDAAKQAQLNADLRDLYVRDGTTLNTILYQIFDGDPAITKSGLARAVISANAIKELPFEWDSEALTLCIDQMTGSNSLPKLLMSPQYSAQRAALRMEVEKAIKEDVKGDVSSATTKALIAAVDEFRRQFAKSKDQFDEGYNSAQDYLTTLASLPRMLNDPSMKSLLASLDEGKDITVGNLIVFMNAYNLRFGPTTSERQVELYRQLIPVLEKIRDQNANGASTANPPDTSGAGLTAAAHAAFKNITWRDLDAHARQN